jgi:hypothetical protein
MIFVENSNPLFVVGRSLVQFSDFPKFDARTLRNVASIHGRFLDDATESRIFLGVF